MQVVLKWSKFICIYELDRHKIHQAICTIHILPRFVIMKLLQILEAPLLLATFILC